MPTHGKFVWYELLTSDPAAAEAFYTEVNGWTAQDSGLPGGKYTIVSAGGVGIGGIMVVPEEAAQHGVKPAWFGYVHVDDVDAAAEDVKDAGGAVHRAPDDIPSVGRFAVVADPQGAVFNLFKNAGGPDRPTVAPGAPGHVGWHELHANDHESAFAFYADLFDWTKGEAHDMGPMGVYQLFSTGDMPDGGMLNRDKATPGPFWLYYFNVDAIDPALQRVKGAGGTVIHGPQQVPGGLWIGLCTDPQGAHFALVGPRG